MTTPTELRLSTRARSLLESAPRHEYILEHYERAADAFHATDNPDGYIGLAVAENKLVWGLLEPKLTAPRSVPGGAVCYDSMIGSIEFRTRIGEFLERTFIGRPVSVEHMAVLGGAGSVLELLFFMLADPGDGVLVPTPSYAGFWSDLETRDELSIIPVHTRADTGFRLTTAHLDAALAAADRPVKVLLYTNPSNPLGTIAPASEITDVIEWGATNGVHVVIDEIYALSVHGAAPFVSAASLAPSLPRHVHLVWAFSKDFGMSGMRCGVLVTEDERVMEAVDALAYWAAVSGDTQHILGEMIRDEAWVDAYLAGMRSALATSYRAVSTALMGAGIGHIPAAAGFFLLADFRRFLDEPTWEAEARLWRRVVDEANVNITPGSACRIAEPGFMRICFATEPADTVVTAIRRIAAVLTD